MASVSKDTKIVLPTNIELENGIVKNFGEQSGMAIANGDKQWQSTYAATIGSSNRQWLKVIAILFSMWKYPKAMMNLIGMQCSAAVVECHCSLDE